MRGFRWDHFLTKQAKSEHLPPTAHGGGETDADFSPPQTDSEALVFLDQVLRCKAKKRFVGPLRTTVQLIPPTFDG